MKKAVIIAVFILIFAIQALAQDIPETVGESLSIEFHAVSGGDKVTLNLVDYFGRKADFVAAQTEHVNVEIDENGIATLSAKDSEWRGIEEVVFAVSEEFLEKEKKPEKKYVLRLRNLTRITSKDKIALISDAFTQEQYETIVGKLTPEPVTISSSISEDSVSVDLNKEVIIDFSVKKDAKSAVPAVSMDFHAKDENITLGYYKEPDNRIFLALVVIGICTILVLGFYLHYMVTGPMRSTLLKPKKKVMRESRAGAYKGKALAGLRKIRKSLSSEKPAKAYKDTLLLMNSFLSRSFRLQGSAEQMAKKLGSYGVSGSVKSDILSYYTDYREAAYKASEITKNDTEKLIRFVESILKRV